MSDDQTETFKIMEFLIVGNIFLIFLLELEIYCPERFQLDFFANRVIYF